MAPLNKNSSFGSFSSLLDISNCHHHGRETIPTSNYKEFHDQDSNVTETEVLLADGTYLTLPEPCNTKRRIRLDEHLCQFDVLTDSAAKFLNVEPVKLDSNDKFLNVLQGEYAHATPDQTDYLLSTDATTCHIIAVRSSTDGGENILGSLAHLDREAPGFIHNLVRGHLHELGIDSNCDLSEIRGNKIRVEFHVMGGFDDVDGMSLSLSEFIFQELSQVAELYANIIEMTLQTCVVSGMNDTGSGCPIGRGLGLNIQSGRVFLASPVERYIAGPAIELRCARLFQPNAEMICIHSADKGRIEISPFEVGSFEGLETLLELDDRTMLLILSTSPNVELSDRFCGQIRRTLRYMVTHNGTSVFGKFCNEPRCYSRECSLTKWVLV